MYNYKKQIYIILELCDGGDLYTRLPYSEKRAAGITGKLMSAIKYMHDHGIVHRDLKFENIMFENKSDNAEIKVIDCEYCGCARRVNQVNCSFDSHTLIFY